MRRFRIKVVPGDRHRRRVAVRSCLAASSPSALASSPDTSTTEHTRPAGHAGAGVGVVADGGRPHTTLHRARRRPNENRVRSGASHVPLAHHRSDLISALEQRGYERTTPIQSAVLPYALAGRDLIGCAETGTGKTAAYLLPILSRLLRENKEGYRAPSGVTRALVLAPTRELATQIDDEIQGFAYHAPVSSVAVYGGMPMEPQERALKAGVDIVVATPGRLLDHMRSSVGDFSKLEVFVLDEADRMMDMGFWPDVRRIISAIPGKRQTLLFSATMPDDVVRLALEIVHEPKFVQVGQRSMPAKSITHRAHVVPAHEKLAWLTEHLRRHAGPVLVFNRTKVGAERLAQKLGSSGIRCVALHADRTQEQRRAAVEGFRGGKYKVLVATDIAARGLDIDGIHTVINYELPDPPDAYVHRVGRTGRADEVGLALTLVATR